MILELQALSIRVHFTNLLPEMKVTRHKQGSSGRVVASGQKDLNTKTESPEIRIFPNSVLIGDSHW